MEIELMYPNAYTLGRIHLTGGEQVRVEAASMVGMSGGVTVETKATGGFMQSLKRSLLGGESFSKISTQLQSRGAMCSWRPPCLAT